MIVRRLNVAEPLTFDLIREEIHVASVIAKRVDHDVAYVRLKQFQDGTHEELLTRPGLYRRLHEMQFFSETESLPVTPA